VVDRVTDIHRVTETEFGLDEIYICDDETGYHVDYSTIFDGGGFTACRAYGRTKNNRAYWPEENQRETVIKGTGK
jgi:hypothetical protein